MIRVQWEDGKSSFSASVSRDLCSFCIRFTGGGGHFSTVSCIQIEFTESSRSFPVKLNEKRIIRVALVIRFS